MNIIKETYILPSRYFIYYSQYRMTTIGRKVWEATLMEYAEKQRLPIFTSKPARSKNKSLYSLVEQLNHSGYFYN